jgi:hypothetical protein
MKYPLADILQWWTMQSEQFRRETLATVYPGSTIQDVLAYGLVKNWHVLPLAAKLAIGRAYETQYQKVTI